METEEKKSVTEKIVSGYRAMLTEIEEWRVQAALGKAEAKDIYEESKKKFNLFLHESKAKLGVLKTKTESGVDQVKGAFEALQVQLALGKAESKEVFEEQSKKISKALHDLENSIKGNETTNEYYTKLRMEAEKFKIKLEILQLRYELKKLDVREDFEMKKQSFLQQLAETKERLLSKEEEHGSRWEGFRDEMSEAFTKLKKVFA
jgi:hypothetical protein